jgi:hypothetical protein
MAFGPESPAYRLWSWLAPHSWCSFEPFSQHGGMCFPRCTPTDLVISRRAAFEALHAMWSARCR